MISFSKNVSQELDKYLIFYFNSVQKSNISFYCTLNLVFKSLNLKTVQMIKKVVTNDTKNMCLIYELRF